MITRAKFKCDEVVKRLHWIKDKGFIYSASFSPITSGSEENERFFAATPSGSIVIGTISESTFEPGKEYYIDFIEVEK